jgi:cell fate (sporulation/competence/biofilm development) regulator YlbF (YheA/YmcA/DUF963 family)
LPYENLQTLKTDFDNMQEDLLERLRTIDEISQHLIHDNDKWIKFNDELKRLETLFKEISLLIESKSFADKPLEEKQKILEVQICLVFIYKSIFIL